MKMIEENELSVLEEIESIIRRPLPNRYGRGFCEFGYEVHDGKIIKLGLYNCKLKSLPESIQNLTSLKNLYLKEKLYKMLPPDFREIWSKDIKIENFYYSIVNGDDDDRDGSIEDIGDGSILW